MRIRLLTPVAACFANEILPVVALGQRLAELVVAYAPAAGRRTDAGLLNRSKPCAGRRRVSGGPAHEAELVGAQQRADNPVILRSAWGAAADDAFFSADIEVRALTDCGKEDQRFDPNGSLRASAAAQRFLPPKDGRQAFGFAVGHRQRVVRRHQMAIGGPYPSVSVATDGPRPGLDLDQDKSGRRQDEGVDLVDPAVVVDELEVRPSPPWVKIGQVGPQEIEGVPFPLVGRLSDRCPTPYFHALNRLLKLPA